jgi:hypothetical protein
MRATKLSVAILVRTKLGVGLLLALPCGAEKRVVLNIKQFEDSL